MRWNYLETPMDISGLAVLFVRLYFKGTLEKDNAQFFNFIAYLSF